MPVRKSPLRDWEKIPYHEGESPSERVKRSDYLLKLRKKVKQTINHLKKLAKANPKNHGWEDREIERLEGQLSGIYSLNSSLNLDELKSVLLHNY